MSIMILPPGERTGCVKIPASKSQAHRLLICAALGKSDTEIICDGISQDIAATAECLSALGAGIELADGRFLVKPIERQRRLHFEQNRVSCSAPLTGASKQFVVTSARDSADNAICENAIADEERTSPSSGAYCQAFSALQCGESGSTLRFLIPVVGALGKSAVFHMKGRLPERPLAPFDDELRAHGMEIRREGDLLYCSGKLRAGAYRLPGNVSSQYISGLLMSLPFTDGDSTLEITGSIESEGYITMTEEALRLAGINFEKRGNEYMIPGGQCASLPKLLEVEGDYSNAAFFLCMGALSERGVRVLGLSADSRQGDRAVIEILSRFGAEITESRKSGADSGTGSETSKHGKATHIITVKKGKNGLHGITIDAGPIPDLIPVLSAVAAAAEGETRIINAGRLRIKESDRLRTTTEMLTNIGADITELDDGLIIKGKERLGGGIVDSANDHRIAMAAAVASCISSNPVTVKGSECIAKSYPYFWEDFEALERVRQIKGE